MMMPQEFAPSPGGKKVTMGDFVRDILLEQARAFLVLLWFELVCHSNAAMITIHV